jgi:uncharacterized membrane protein
MNNVLKYRYCEGCHMNFQRIHVTFVMSLFLQLLWKYAISTMAFSPFIYIYIYTYTYKFFLTSINTIVVM